MYVCARVGGEGTIVRDRKEILLDDTHVCPVVTEETCSISLVVVGGVHQRRHPKSIHCVHVGTVLKETLQHLQKTQKQVRMVLEVCRMCVCAYVVPSICDVTLLHSYRVSK